MRYITLVCLLFLMQQIFPKMWINPDSEIRFGPCEVLLFGGIEVDVSKENNFPAAKSAGLYFEPSARLRFIGSSEDSLKNVYYLKSVTLDKGSGNLWMGNNLDVSGNLNFISGFIITGADTLSLTGATTSIIGETAQRMVLGNAKIQRYIGTGSSVTSGHFGGIGFKINNTGSDLGIVTLHRKTGEGSQVTILGSEGVKRQWTIQTSVPFSGTRNVTADWFGSEDNGNRFSNLKVWKYEAGSWDSLSASEFSTGTDPRTATFDIVTATSYTVNNTDTYFAGGKGTYDDPYLIKTPQHLDSLRYFTGEEWRNCYFKQIADIDLGTAPWNAGEGWDPIATDWVKPFKAKYDGNYHKISNLTIDRDSLIYNYVSLFGLTNSALLQNIIISDAQVQGTYSTGILAGYSDSTTVENCMVSGSINGEGTVGGLIGYTESRLYISKCISTVAVSSKWSYAGGMVGYAGNYSYITDCYNTGSVQGESYLGGLIGYNSQSYVVNCYSTGSVSGTSSYIGGLIGYSYMSYVTDSYWNTETSGQATSYGGEGKTTDDMKYPFDTNTYLNWDFSYTPIWIGNSDFNNGYPYLSWEIRTAPTIPQNLTILIASGNVTLNWSAVEGASAYRVYSSVNPYGSFTLDTSGSFNGTEWTAPVTEQRKFFYVTAVIE